MPLQANFISLGLPKEKIRKKEGKGRKKEGEGEGKKEIAYYKWF